MSNDTAPHDPGFQSDLPPPDAADVVEQFQRIAGDAHGLVGRTRSTISGARSWALRAVGRQPFIGISVAMIVGYVAAGGLASPLTRIVLGAGVRVAAVRLLNGLYTAILEDEE